MASENGPLPPGWDSKFDPRTGRYYFINHYTKSTSWEDPRVRYQQIGKSGGSGAASTSSTTGRPAAAGATSRPQTGSSESTSSEKRRHTLEHIPLQTYPIGNIPAPSSECTSAAATALQDRVKATGSPAPPNHVAHSSSGAGTGVQASPLPLQRLQLEESLNGPSSPRSTSIQHRRESHVLADISENETLNSEQAVQNIAAMFPTVDEAHIRDLLRKYHGSQAVVISALQVAKHPFITPGPATVFTPPPTRHSTLPGSGGSGSNGAAAFTGSLPHYYQQSAASAYTPRDVSVSSSGYPTPRPGSAASGFDNSFSMGSPQIGQSGGNLVRSFPKPHSSPKMKLRYLKSVFPTVEEYLLLDVLSNSDNNVQKAADRLVKMGYVKRDTPSAPRLHARRKEEERLAEKRTPLPKPPPIKSDKEKAELRRKMRDKYEAKFDIPERILYMALESVLYDEDQANNLIIAMIEDDLKRKKAKESEKAKEKEKKSSRKSPKPTRKNIECDRQPRHLSPKHEPRKGPHGKKGWSSKTNIAKEEIVVTTATRGTSTQDETDGHYRPKAKGPNPTLRKGPNDDLLLTDYVTWNGPDPELRKGANSTFAKGSNMSFRKGSQGLVKGSNPAFRKGPMGLAKGSIYARQEQEDAKVGTRGG